MPYRSTVLWRISLGVTLGALGFVSLASSRPMELSAASASTTPTVAGCPTLPADNVWNARVDQLAVHPRSADYLTSIGLGTGLHADFGSGTWNGGPIGISYT